MLERMRARPTRRPKKKKTKVARVASRSGRATRHVESEIRDGFLVCGSVRELFVKGVRDELRAAPKGVRRWRIVPAEPEGTSVPWREALKGHLDAGGGEAASVLRGLRAREDMTQEKLAEELETTQSNVAAMESGRRSIGKAMAKRLAAVFRVDYRIFL